MDLIEALKNIFHQGVLSLENDEKLVFEGVLGGECRSVTELENAIGDSLPNNIKRFIQLFGGTRLYVCEYGLGVSILAPNEIVSHNIYQQKTTEEFFPKFVIIGYSSSDDMLVLGTEGAIRFGILDHEAWGEPKLWQNQAISWYDFDAWLGNLMISNGEVLIK
ncbi:SMI1/KNR4 family protein [Pseudomonas indica]|uniref:SMI1/KNR4 family protein n=1 Tax=Pseudomonas indica TaxID=137658 RepID=UPI001140E51B|nr:SMI1/KNR4 family protein [Pseudomonas indica]